MSFKNIRGIWLSKAFILQVAIELDFVKQYMTLKLAFKFLLPLLINLFSQIC